MDKTKPSVEAIAPRCQARHGTALCGIVEMSSDVIPLDCNEQRFINADLSADFDGSLVFSFIERTQDLFD